MFIIFLRFSFSILLVTAGLLRPGRFVVLVGRLLARGDDDHLVVALPLVAAFRIDVLGLRLLRYRRLRVLCRRILWVDGLLRLNQPRVWLLEFGLDELGRPRSGVL